jgi:hypothetical protein
MLERISFQLANNRARYTHFIHSDGTIASLAKLQELHEARVGVMVEADFPTEAQYEAIELLACYATGENPSIIATFEEATAPFAARFPPGHIMNTYLEMTEGV